MCTALFLVLFILCSLCLHSPPAQDEMAGVGVGISEDLISLEIASPDVPDLTLIDLPGIARVAVKGQPENIGDQVNMPLLEYVAIGKPISYGCPRQLSERGYQNRGGS